MLQGELSPCQPRKCWISTGTCKGPLGQDVRKATPYVAVVEPGETIVAPKARRERQTKGSQVKFKDFLQGMGKRVVLGGLAAWSILKLDALSRRQCFVLHLVLPPQINIPQSTRKLTTHIANLERSTWNSAEKRPRCP